MADHRIIVFLLTVASGVTSAQGQQPRQVAHDGYWWTANTEMFQVGFVTGYLEALASVSNGNSSKCLLEKAREHQGKPPLDDKAVGEIVSACGETPAVKAYDFSGFRFGQWSDGVSEFYKDFRNRGLVVELALSYVRDQLHGVPAKELEDEVTLWRRNAAH